MFGKFSRKNRPNSSLRTSFMNKYSAFRNLLIENNRVLTLIADMQEKLSGEYLFDKQYINSNASEIADRVNNIIKHLNALSAEKYLKLYDRYDSVRAEIESAFLRKVEIPESELTLPLEKLTGEMYLIAGGKFAQLGEVRNRLGIQTPDGFVITSHAFKKFTGHNNLVEQINERLSALDIRSLEALNRVSSEIQDIVVNSEVPDDLCHAVAASVEVFKQTSGEQRPLFAIRSSAIFEDGEFSFAGQYATFLSIPEAAILQKYKEVVASLFTPRAIFYYKTKGFSDEEMVMAVGVLKMVDAKAGGVAYTRDPNNPEIDHITINAVPGLGKSVVDGTVSPDLYIVSRHPENIIKEKRVSRQQTMLIGGDDGNIKTIAIPDNLKNSQSIDDKQIKQIAQYALEMERHYDAPQDIEWVIEQDGEPSIIQTRPLRTVKTEGDLCVPRRIAGKNLLIDKGVIACKGIGHGKAFILKDEEELKEFPEGSVLIAKNTSTKFVTVMNKASAIITDVGGITGHMASLSREYNIPTILDTEIATTTIKNGQLITVDAVNCNIYEGVVEELLNLAPKKKDHLRETILYKTLERVLKHISPLNLVNPAADTFTPEHCMTFHDITRFAHEKAMNEMFSIGEGHNIDSLDPVELKAGIPMNTSILDIDGCISTNSRKVSPGDIDSIPFSAFFKGLAAMKWPEPRPADLKGFFEMVAHTASIPEEELRQTGEQSFALLSKNYMNFSIRLGYHFSMVEAYAGYEINNNYIKFFFKGGGASIDRRIRRTNLIKEILKMLDFSVTVKDDVVDAILSKYRQSSVERILELIGRFTVFTKQLDMALYNDAVVEMFVEEFAKDHLHQD